MILPEPCSFPPSSHSLVLQQQIKGIPLQPLKSEVTKAEKELEKVSQELEKLDVALADPELYTKDKERAAKLGQMRARALERQAALEELWLEKSTEYEDAKAL